MINKLVGAIAKQIATLLTGVLSGAVISALPMLLVNHRHLGLLFASLSWQKKSFVAVCLIAGAIVYMSRSLFDQKNDKSRQAKLLSILAIVYLCCYTTCAALCQKLNITAISLPRMAADADMSSNLYSGADSSIVASAGLALVIFAAIIQMAAVAGPQGQKKAILRSVDWSWLVFMAGVPLIFSVWLPLIALPGTFIVLKWIAEPTPKRIIN